MTEINLNKPEKKKIPINPYRDAEYEEFIIFCATPKPFRELKTQEAFQVKFQVSHETINQWKKTDGFWDKVAAVRNESLRQYTPDILASLYKTLIQKATGRDVETWMKIVEGWREEQPPSVKINMEMTPEDQALYDKLTRKNFKDK